MTLKLYLHNSLFRATRTYLLIVGVLLVSIAPRTVLSSSKFIHLCNTLLELLILALFVAVSLILLMEMKLY
jgi:hypothetical protein